jgi:hypothetical protein
MAIAALWWVGPGGVPMSMKDLMLEQLAISRRIVSDGHENVPAWRIETPEGAWLILTRFDPDKQVYAHARPGESSGRYLKTEWWALRRWPWSISVFTLIGLAMVSGNSWWQGHARCTS